MLKDDHDDQDSGSESDSGDSESGSSTSSSSTDDEDRVDFFVKPRGTLSQKLKEIARIAKEYRAMREENDKRMYLSPVIYILYIYLKPRLRGLEYKLDICFALLLA